MAIHWHAWSLDSFEQARSARKPVLLSIAATWCASCAEMDRSSYADPRVVSIVSEQFVPVRVDADRRPDIAERYNLGGLPTTAFLTGAGAVVGGGTFVDADRLAAALEQVVSAFASRADELHAADGRAPREHPPSAARIAGPEDLARQVYDAFDPGFGGFGREPKFPLVAPLELLLQKYRESREGTLRSMLVHSLDAMGWGGLYDDVDGGFFRCASGRDWKSPHHEKLLDVNGALLGVYATASHDLQEHRYAERAQDVLRYVQTWLADQAEGGWFGSQASSPSYYSARTPEARRALTPPAVDGVLYASANATAVSAALRAAQLFDDQSLAAFALRSLERVVLATYVPGEGVAHAFDGAAGVRGLLDDQIAMAIAHLDAYDATADIPYQMMAEELAHYAIRTMWDEEQGGFFDRAPAPEGELIGRMAERLKPFVGNCEAARLLRRLAAASGDLSFASRADATLESVAARAGAEGPLAAHYLLALGQAGSGDTLPLLP